MVLGARIKEARENNNFTQAKLGKIINVSKVAICGWEKGNRIPRLSKLEELSDVLNVSVNYLMGNDSDIIMENSEYQKITLSKEEILIIRELRKYNELYLNLVDNPKRTVEMLSKISKFEK